MRSLRDASVGEAVRYARTCYDHLAGRLGVELAAALEREHTRLEKLGIDLHELSKQRRTLVRPCLDWSEQKWHIGGALGVALAGRLFPARLAKEERRQSIRRGNAARSGAAWR